MFLARVNGDELLLGVDDVVEFLSQYGRVEMGRGDKFYLLPHDAPPLDYRYTTDTFPETRGWPDLMVDACPDKTLWDFAVWRLENGRATSTYCSCDLTEAINTFLELTRGRHAAGVP